MTRDTMIILDDGGNPVWCPLEPVYAEALGLAVHQTRRVVHPAPRTPRPRYAPITDAERLALRN